MNSEITASNPATGQSRIGTPLQAPSLEYPIDDKTEARIKYFKDHGCVLEWAFTLMLLERIEALEDKITRIDDLETRLKRLEDKIFPDFGSRTDKLPTRHY